MRVSIAAKLFLGFLIVIFLNVAFFFIISKMGDLNSITNMIKRQNEIKSVLLRIKSQRIGQDVSFSSYDRLGRHESAETFRETSKKMVKLIDTLSSQIDTILLLDSIISKKSFLNQNRSTLINLSELCRKIKLYNNLSNAVFDSIVEFRSSRGKFSLSREKVLKDILEETRIKFNNEIDSAQYIVDNQSNVRLKDVESRINNVKQTTIVIIGAITAFALLFGLFFSRAITNALRKLKESASTIGKGHFDFDPTGYPNDEIGDLAAAFFDMSIDLKNAQEELVHSKRLAAIGEVVASVNHEINNPLMIISGNAQFLEMMMEGYPEEMRERVRAILEETERISTVTKKLREIKNPVVEDYTSSGEQMINLDKSSV